MGKEMIEKFVAEQIQDLQSFIYDECIENSGYEETSNYAINKTIRNVVSTISRAYEEELSTVKEQYYQKALDNQQGLLAQFSEILDRAVTSLAKH